MRNDVPSRRLRLGTRKPVIRSHPARNGGVLDQGGSSGGGEKWADPDVLEYKLQLSLLMDWIQNVWEKERNQGQLPSFWHDHREMSVPLTEMGKQLNFGYVIYNCPSDSHEELQTTGVQSQVQVRDWYLIWGVVRWYLQLWHDTRCNQGNEYI